MSERLLTYEDVSARWQIAINTLRIWVMKGTLVPIKLGRAVRFKESYIEALEQKGIFK
jgi:predicted site-specific integrase-resolvase